MRRTAFLAPLGSFVLAVLLSVVCAPASRQLLRAADAPTGGTTPPCAKWELTKHTAEAKKWALRVTDLPSTMTTTERAIGNEITHTTVKAEVRGHLRGSPGWTFEELPGTYNVLIDNASYVRNPGVWPINLRVQSVAQNQIKSQIREQFKNTQVDLLGNPIPPGDVIVLSVDLIDQVVDLRTDGVVFCLKSRVAGEFIPRPVTFAVTAGNGTGTN